MNATTPDVKTVFGKAMEIDSAAERAAYLDQACGNNLALRAEVEALLGALGHAADFMQEPAAVQAGMVVADALAEQPGGMIGPYRLMEEIGAGGMGLVFVAEQQAPVRRKVALKVVKPGMDTREVMNRFAQERQALALMDHPNIAQVFDGGATPAGRPYFEMELVRGLPITKFCDQHALSLRQRLELFLPVCGAVQHAHQKGIIHRDLKPGNILVALHDDKPAPKVIDFGVAKAVGEQLTQNTVYTRFAQMVGTPLYMSPEQAGMSSLDIDTRSDIYSLGVLLYELLTGTTPFDQKRLRQAEFDEIRRIIREEEPPKPSTRLSELSRSAEPRRTEAVAGADTVDGPAQPGGSTLTTISARRQTEPAKLSKLLRGDLDWIVMKCLEKDRTRRYQTANELAMELQRYLADEPVLAGPPSAAYRMRKFVRRNKGPVLAACLVFVALTGGIVGTTLGMIEGYRGRDAAEIARGKAVRSAQAAFDAAAAEQKAKNLAEQRLGQTRAALDFVETKIFARNRPEGFPGGLGRDTTVRQALDAALPFVETSFKDQPAIEARLRFTLGSSYFYLSEFKIAADQFQMARTIYANDDQYGPYHPDTLRSMHNLASCYLFLGRSNEALKLNEETLALRQEKLGPYDRDTLQSMSFVAVSYARLGRLGDALKLYEETLALRKEKLGLDDPDTLHSMYLLAGCYAGLDRHADALRLHKETLALRQAKLGPHDFNTLDSIDGVAGSYVELGRPADAVKLLDFGFSVTPTRLPEGTWRAA